MARTDITSYSSMYPSLSKEISGLTQNIATMFLADAGRQFCIDSELYEYELAEIDIVSGTTEYSLSSLLPADTYIHRIEKVFYGEDGMDVYNDSPLNGGQYELNRDQDTFKLLFTPTENITDGLIVIVILVPLPNKTNLDSVIFYRYYDAIISKAKELIYASPKKPFTDPELSKENLLEYKRLLEEAEEDKKERLYSAIAKTDITSYSSMYLSLSKEINGLTQNVATTFLADAGRQFCIDSELYEYELAEIDIVSGTTEYSLSGLLPSNTYIHRIKKVFYGEDGMDVYNDSPLSCEQFEFNRDQDAFKLLFTPTADITDGLIVFVILIPLPNKTNLDTVMLYRYYDAIIAKAKELIYSSSKKPFTNPELSRDNLLEYRRLLGEAKRDKLELRKNKRIQAVIDSNIF